MGDSGQCLLLAVTMENDLLLIIPEAGRIDLSIRGFQCQELVDQEGMFRNVVGCFDIVGEVDIFIPEAEDSRGLDPEERRIRAHQWPKQGDIPVGDLFLSNPFERLALPLSI